MAIERELFGDEAWSDDDVLVGARAARHPACTWSSTTTTGGVTAYCRPVRLRRRTRPTSRPSRSRRRRSTAVSAPRCSVAMLDEADRARLRARRPGGPRRQRLRAPALPAARVHRHRGTPRLLPAQRHRRHRHAQGARGVTAAPSVLGIETSCDETGVGIVRGIELLADALASSVEEHARFGGVVPEVASRAHLEAMVPTMHRALEQAGLTPRRDRRDRGHRRPGPRRRAAGRGRGGQGLRARGSASRCTASTTCRRTSRSTGWSTATCDAAVASRCWSRAVTPRCCSCPTSPARCRRSAPPSTTRQVRRSTRSPGCWGCRSPAARTSTGWPRDGDRPRSSSRAAWSATRPCSFTFSGLKTAVARWVEAGSGPANRCRSPTSPRRSRRRSPTCSPRARSRPAGSTASAPSSSAAASPPTPGCGRWPRSAATAPGSRSGRHRRSCAPTMAPWSPRSGHCSSSATSSRRRSTWPADSSMVLA